MNVHRLPFCLREVSKDGGCRVDGQRTVVKKIGGPVYQFQPVQKAEKEPDVVVDPDDDFEEFAPVDISSLGE